MKYAIKIPFDDGWLYATEYDMNDEFSTVVTTYDTKEDAEEHAKLWKGSIVVEYTETDRYEKISRVEVIGSDGREYVRYFKEDESMYYMIQDEGRTLKIVIEKENE